VIPWSPLGGGMLTGKYKFGEEPQEGTRFAAPGPFQAVWRTRSLNERNHAIVSVVLDESRQLNASPIAVALAWNLARPGITSPIIGPKTVAQLSDNLAALEVELPAEAIERIDAASEPHLPYPHDFMRMARQMTAMMVQQNAPASTR
jgi:aryl-alcohol dehydrogenase-like predicted oxidoreductase